ncbi:MAG: dsRBD fold-containing protein [Mycobacterium sp.]
MADDSSHVCKGWVATISIDEHDGQTRAKARLRWRDQEAVGVGLARLAPTDRYHAHIGDELAVARALADLARRMMAGTVQHIDGLQQPAGSPR